MITKPAALFGLEDKVALVTGGGAGIGREVANCLAGAGARVIIADRDREAGAMAASEIAEAGFEAEAVPVDIAEPASVDLLFARFTDFGTGLDILVNNAAIFPKYATLEITAEQWDELHRVTLRGTMLMSQGAVRLMRIQGRGGRIINISSCSSIQTLVHDNVAYGTAKAGVNMLTKAYALEFANDGITVNAVLPGGVDTGGARQMQGSRSITGPIRGEGRVPLGRVGTPADIAAAVLYLASPAADYVTGRLLAVDGGFLIS